MNNKLFSVVNRSLAPGMKKAGYVSRLFSSDCFDCRLTEGRSGKSFPVVPSRSQVAITSGFPASRLGRDWQSVNPFTLYTLEPLTLSNLEFGKTPSFAKLPNSFRWGDGRLQRGGDGHLLSRSSPFGGDPSRCPSPHSPTYVVHEVSRKAEDSAFSTLLRASLRKAALKSDDSLSYAARPNFSLFSKLAAKQTDRTASQSSASQSSAQLMEGRN
jgi:hypothetical protein